MPAPKKRNKTVLKKITKKALKRPSKVVLKRSSKAVFVQPGMRLEVVYKGRVQGVGFRFNAEQAALGCGVTGWVRNEPNGDVKLVAEGPETCLLKLLEAIRQCSVGRHIKREQIRWECHRKEFDDFKIEYHL